MLVRVSECESFVKSYNFILLICMFLKVGCSKLHVNLKAHQIHVFRNFPIDLPLSVLFSSPSEIKSYISAAAKKAYISV
jgi:hypothetical protein